MNRIFSILLTLRADRGGGGGGILPSSIHTLNLLTNYPTKLHEIKMMCIDGVIKRNIDIVLKTLSIMSSKDENSLDRRPKSWKDGPIIEPLDGNVLLYRLPVGMDNQKGIGIKSIEEFDKGMEKVFYSYWSNKVLPVFFQ